MNTICFLSGVGAGSLLVTFLVIAFLGYASKKAVLSTENRDEAKRVNDELIAIHKERNRLVGLQTNSLCNHRSVTVSEDPTEAHCDRCGFALTFNKQAGNWE